MAQTDKQRIAAAATTADVYKDLSHVRDLYLPWIRSSLRGAESDSVSGGGTAGNAAAAVRWTEAMAAYAADKGIASDPRYVEMLTEAEGICAEAVGILETAYTELLPEEGSGQ